MFTGLVAEVGTVVALDTGGGTARLTVRGPGATAGCAHGESIAVDGVCLTVTDVRDGTFTADVMAETLDRSNLGSLTPGARVNLEHPVPLSGRLGGHLVQGHVDGTAVIVTRRPDRHYEVLRIALPPGLPRYVAGKGSIAVDGVSLTVSAVGDDWFEVSLIPETLRASTLGDAAPGDTVNLEVDVIAKYVERLLGSAVRR